MQSRSISAASPSSYRRTPATARRAISRRWRTATSMPMWRPAGPETPLPAPLQVSPPPRSSRRNRQADRRAPRECAPRLRPAGDRRRVEARRAKIKAGGHASPYRLRKQLPEPVFGQIKQARGFRQFLLRGVEKVAAEWGLVCLAHNILKLAQRRTPFPAALATG